jgi:hypothetical protein
VYRSTHDLDTSAAWLERHTSAGQVVAADWQVANYLAPRVGSAVTYGGHPVASLHPQQKQFEIATLFAHGGDPQLARRLGVDWMVYGPAEADMAGPAADVAFSSGAVRVYRIGGGQS